MVFTVTGTTYRDANGVIRGLTVTQVTALNNAIVTDTTADQAATVVAAALNITREVALGLIADVCFPRGTTIETDQGIVEIQDINVNYHTIRTHKILAVTNTYSNKNYLVNIKKNAFGNIPTKDTKMTGNHLVFYNGLIKAKDIKHPSVEHIHYDGEMLYNILLDHHDLMIVNGIVCETLNPDNPIAKLYYLTSEYPEKKIELEQMWRETCCN